MRQRHTRQLPRLILSLSFLAQSMKDSLPTAGVAGLPSQVIDQVRKQLGCGRVRHALVGGNSQPGSSSFPADVSCMSCVRFVDRVLIHY
jgi:hypothetical protein